MVWTLESVTEALGGKAQFTARGIVVVDYNELSVPNHILIAEFVGEDTFCVTSAGSEYLKAYAPEEDGSQEPSKPAKKQSKKASADVPVVEGEDPISSVSLD